ncbi:hypothetical protein [Rhodoferax sp.]|uniref:hypothetical protein n=1 Tax=Rhodoferax sp. TaxID=50421 RepID=UPI001ED49420|nr:hypothetical protein [Rhodoferax sp.]MBT9505076.1 hypothetical protein [Rhodoferax sp.]
MNHLSIRLAGIGVLILAGSACYGSDPLSRPFPDRQEARKAFEPAQWKTVSDERLGGQRGGFDVGAGLSLSFGIIRSVSINGIVVAATSFILPDVTKITNEQAKLASAAIAQVTVVQNGAGNFVDSSVTAKLPSGTIIQNSLDNQTIQNLTVINASVNSMGLFKTANTQAALKDALFGSVGVR